MIDKRHVLLSIWILIHNSHLLTVGFVKSFSHIEMADEDCAVAAL